MLSGIKRDDEKHSSDTLRTTPSYKLAFYLLSYIIYHFVEKNTTINLQKHSTPADYPAGTMLPMDVNSCYKF